MPSASERVVAARFRAALIGAAALVLALTSHRAGSQAPAAEPGSDLQIYVMTMGPGDAIWERFGHNALGIRDATAGTDVVYNWGVFRFTEAEFLPRFLRGEMRYSVEAYDARATVAGYQSINRSVELQELSLTPAQRLAIKRYVEWNALEENKYYHYDYFGDNCSTRVRDVLDRALGGALRQQFAATPSGMTFRDEARRLTDRDVLYTGIDIGLGSPSDREMSSFESMFIPMRLRDALRAVQVTGQDGRTTALVSAEHTEFTASRIAERSAPANYQLRYLLIGLAIAGGLVALVRVAPAWGGGAAAIWCAVSGVLGLLLAGLWMLTSHVWAYQNVNLLFFNPLWFGVAVVAGRRRTLGITGRRLLAGVAGLAAIGVALGLAQRPQASEQVALLVVAPHALIFWLLLRQRSG